MHKVITNSRTKNPNNNEKDMKAKFYLFVFLGIDLSKSLD